MIKNEKNKYRVIFVCVWILYWARMSMNWWLPDTPGCQQVQLRPGLNTVGVFCSHHCLKKTYGYIDTLDAKCKQLNSVINVNSINVVNSVQAIFIVMLPPPLRVFRESKNIFLNIEKIPSMSCRIIDGSAIVHRIKCIEHERLAHCQITSATNLWLGWIGNHHRSCWHDSKGIDGFCCSPRPYEENPKS